ncbi:MAG: polymerase subunit sigma, partial [Candidatus Nomurabacteria bacterium]|nr:polymerase subunit sigma [Candidatus Nomurabacteria bacterium]
MRQLRITQSITKRDAPSLDTYLQEIGKISLITEKEEVRLAKL